MVGMISVIVPVYNVEKYLSDGLDSILRQDYRNLEIILIDDGSMDGSAEICEEYARKDDRICVIHKKNGGAASAKNEGLRIARGEYLSFVDADDYLAAGAYSYMVELLEREAADVVQCAYQCVFRDGLTEGVSAKVPGEYSAAEYLELYTKDWTCALLWDKLYKRSLFDGIFFEEGHIVDDEFFTYQGIMNAGKIVYDGCIVYNYRQRRSSVTGRPEYRERTLFDKLDYLEKRRKNISAGFPELKRAFDIHYLDMLVWISRDPYVTVPCLESVKEKLRAYLRQKDATPVDFRRKINLFRLLLRSNDALMKRKDPVPAVSEERFFA